MLYGGGWPEMKMSLKVDNLASKTAGKKSLAIESFSKALRSIPKIIADNAGLDSSDLVTSLRAAHSDGKQDCSSGVDVNRGLIGDMKEMGVFESFRVKRAVLLSATEAAEMILRVDEIVKCAPRPREGR